jgi:hypothetical protein
LWFLWLGGGCSLSRFFCWFFFSLCNGLFHLFQKIR